MPLAAGRQLGPYRIVSPLGAGGMGEVYRARDESLQRDVALKVVLEEAARDDEARGRFEREARAVASLSHPNIVAVHSFGTQDGVRFLVMELLEGETLHERLKRGPLPVAQAAELAMQVADALAAAHEKGVIHRDVKPSNVFLTSGGGVKVLDFGLARAPGPGASDETPTEIRTRSGVAVGTVGYMAPEQLAGEAVDGRSDVFSLGCVLHQMLTGTSPFLRSSATATIAATLRDPAPPLGAAVPAELSRIVTRCLEKDRASRYHSARDLALDLRRVAGGEAAMRDGSGGASAAIPPPSRARRFVALGAGAVLLATATAGWLVLRARERAGAASVSSLAVLPFENASRRPETEYLVDGLTEGLINTLAQLPDLRVVARTTAFTYKGKPLDGGRLRSELGVDAVLTGRVAERDGGYAVQADLIDVRNGTELWGHSYRAADAAGMEQTIAGDVGRRLRHAMTREQRARLDARPTASNEAYRLYLEGRYEWNKRSRNRLERARDLFQQAIEIDPEFAQAHAGLADAYLLMGGQFRLLPQPDALARAEDSARRALALDPDLAAARASLGLVHANQFHLRLAERELRGALELDPSYTMGRMWYALVLKLTQGRHEALAQLRQALTLDPRAPLVAANIAGLLVAEGDAEGALAAARTALDLDPALPGAIQCTGLALESEGRYAEAAAAYHRLQDGGGPPNQGRALLARLAARQGRLAEARREARALEALWPTGEIAPTHIAWVYAGLHDNDAAFAWLERAFENRDVSLRDVCLRNYQCSDLEGDPRYAALVRRMLSPEP